MRALWILVASLTCAAALYVRQPIINSDGDNLYDGKASFKGDYGVDAGEASTAMGGSKSAQPPGYRSAWEDCGGAGASATDRLRSIAATIKGFAKQVKFVRNAAQDCGHVKSNGLHPGPGVKVVYPGPSVFKAATDGRATAQGALEKYGTKAAFLSVGQPIINSDGDNLYDGKASFKGDYGVDAGEASTAMGGSKSAQPPGYRSAWEDCGGAGASATDRLRSIAATIKGFAKQVKFVRNAAQDCGHVNSNGLRPGPGVKVVYPGPSVFKAATDGRATAQAALEKYGTKAALLNVRQPIINSDGDNLYDGKASFKGDYGVDAGEASTAMGGSKSAQPPGYRSAWEDCGGAGASATDRLRSIAATIKGFAKQVKFVRNAAQDCGHVSSDGLHPGPGVKVVYPGPSVFKAATDGRATAQAALEKYGTKAALLSVRQPIINSDGDNLYDGKASFKGDYGVDAGEASTAMGGSKSAQPPGYRSAWEDCGGAGASATDRLRSIAATIKGFAKQVKFVRNAAQDCGHVNSNGLRPGPGVKVVYPGPSVFKAATDGRATAEAALKKYGTKA